MEYSKVGDFLLGFAGVIGIVFAWWFLAMWGLYIVAHFALVVSIVAFIVQCSSRQRPYMALGAGFGTALFLAVGACFVVVVTNIWSR